MQTDDQIYEHCVAQLQRQSEQTKSMTAAQTATTALLAAMLKDTRREKIDIMVKALSGMLYQEYDDMDDDIDYDPAPANA